MFVELNSSRSYGSKRGQESAPQHEYQEPSDTLKDTQFFFPFHHMSAAELLEKTLRDKLQQAVY